MLRPELVRDPAYYITRSSLGRKLREEESGLGIFWEGEITADETIIVDADEARRDLRRYRETVLARLR